MHRTKQKKARAQLHDSWEELVFYKRNI